MSLPAAPPPATVVFATDNAYCQHLAVALLSLLEHNPHRALDVRVICIGVDDVNKSRLAAVGESAGRAIRFIDFDPKPYVGFRVDGHISWASYARIFIPKLIDAEIDRVLYLDSDILVLGAIDPLLDADLGGRPVAGVRQPLADRGSDLGIPGDRPYVNAGVLVLDLAAWRREGLTERLVKFIEANPARLKFHDQDAINACFHDRMMTLDFRWNVHHHVVGPSPETLGLTEADRREILRNARIVHFTTSSKPWHFMNEHPFKRDYWRVLGRTPYRRYRCPDVTPVNVAWKAARRAKWMIWALLGRPPARWSLR